MKTYETIKSKENSLIFKLNGSPNSAFQITFDIQNFRLQQSIHLNYSFKQHKTILSLTVPI